MMVELTPIQLLGLVCLLTFSFFVIVILFLECIGRFHCVIRSLTPPKQQNTIHETLESGIETNTDKENTNTQNYHDNDDKGSLSNCRIRLINISSGLGIHCFNTVNCYCCWRESELDSSLIVALPNSHTKLNLGFGFNVRTEEKSCAICLDDLSNKRQLTKLDCGHDFHSKCILKWLQRSDRCPLCKTSVKIDVVSDPLSMDICQTFVLHDLALLDTVSHV